MSASDTEAATMPAPVAVTAKQLRQLDELMLALATGFINLGVEQIDAAIEDGLRRVVQTLAIDRCAISRARPDTGDIRFTYIWPAAGFRRAPTAAVSPHWPWALAAARRGQTVAFSRLAELPPEADADRQTWADLGTRSHVTVPVMMAGELVAMLHLGSFRRERVWPQALLSRLRRVAEIFAIALTRKQGQEELDRALGFEHLATTILAALLKAEPGTDDRAMEAGLRDVGIFLGVDWAAVWERDDAGRGFRRTHQWLGDPLSSTAHRLGVDEVPWLATMLAAGRVVRYAADAELPPEARADLPALRRWGLRSMLAVPIAVAGGPEGLLTCASVREGRAWPDSVVPGVKLLAEVFASVHARRSAERRERAAELDAAQWRERLAHLVRVHTVGEMSAALAHEINQPLMAIANYALAARRRAAELPQSDKVAELLDKVIAQTSRAGDVVGRLRGMVKRNDLQTSAIDLERLLGECIDMVRIECDLRDIRLEPAIAGPVPMIVADGIQLQQVILNLLRNAIEAMEDAPPDAPRAITIDVALVDGRDVAVRVADRGPGLPEGDMERVFEAFFSTKVTGLGIGLSLCRKLIEAHGGTLTARDRPGGGAEFEFTLPIAEANGAEGH